MTSEIIQLRNELAKSNNYETSFLRGCIADLIKDKADRNLLNICLSAGVLQDFFHENTHDTFFINRCTTRLVVDFFITETAAEKAISYCRFLTGKENEIGLIPYKERGGNYWDNTWWGFCDKEKNIIIDCVYEKVDIFCEGLARVKRFGKWSFLDESGKIIFDCKYDSVSNFSGGIARVELNEKWGFIDKSGNEVIECNYEIERGEDYKNLILFNEGFQFVKLNKKWGFIDKSGKEIIEFKYDSYYSRKSRSHSIFTEGNAFVKLNGKIGFVDNSGSTIIPFVYSEACSFYKGIAAVAIGFKKWGFINKTGQILIPLKYEDVNSFSEGLAAVKKDKKWGFINIEGHEIIPFIYESADSFTEGLAAVRNTSNKCGFINKFGEIVIPFKYSNAYQFSEGYAVVEIYGGDDETYYYFVDRFGKENLVFVEDADMCSGYDRHQIIQLHNGISRLEYTQPFMSSNFIGYLSKEGTKYWKD